MATTTITFTLDLDKSGQPGNAARLWLDTSRNDVIEPGEEITFSTINGKAWFAQRDLANPTGMQFLVKFIAPVGTSWSFTAKTAQATLYTSGQQKTTTPKEALAGRL